MKSAENPVGCGAPSRDGDASEKNTPRGDGATQGKFKCVLFKLSRLFCWASIRVSLDIGAVTLLSIFGVCLDLNFGDECYTLYCSIR